VRILVAGAGTGLAAAMLAQSYESRCEVVAVDISKPSLSYGARQAARLNLRNIREWRHQDIESMARQWRKDGNIPFDVVHASGVVHHMRDMKAGICALSSMLRTGGTAAISVYSAGGRRAIVQRLQSHIQSRGYDGSEIEGMRSLREDVFALLGAPRSAVKERDDHEGERGRDLLDAETARSLAKTKDFLTSASGVRDVAFHVHEQQVTWPEFSLMLDACGLRTTEAMPPLQESDLLLRRSFADFLRLRSADASRHERAGEGARLLQQWADYEDERGWPALKMYSVYATKVKAMGID
jgi:SAM-dependent methyltransferase